VPELIQMRHPCCHPTNSIRTPKDDFVQPIIEKNNTYINPRHWRPDEFQYI